MKINNFFQKHIKESKIATLFLFIFLFTSCTNGQTDAEKIFYKAYECGDLDCQLNFLNKAIESNPRYAPAYFGRASVYFIQNKNVEKQADLDKSAELSPDYRDIIIAYDKAFRLFPDNKFILDIRGRLFSIIGSDSEAIESFNRAIEIDPKFPQPYLGRGVYYEYQKENEKALKDFAKAIELDPNFATAYYRHGSMLAVVFKDFEKGISELNKAVELNPNSSVVYNSLGIAHNLKGDYMAAISDLTKSIKLAPDKPEIFRYRASVYKELGKTDLAEKDEARAKELESKKLH